MAKYTRSTKFRYLTSYMFFAVCIASIVSGISGYLINEVTAKAGWNENRSIFVDGLSVYAPAGRKPPSGSSSPTFTQFTQFPYHA